MLPAQLLGLHPGIDLAQQPYDLLFRKPLLRVRFSA